MTSSQAMPVRTSTSADIERKSNDGKFAPGNPGGSGNPYARQIAALRGTFFEVLTVDDMRSIVKALIQLAVDGKLSAARLVLQYTIGKPVAIESERFDSEPAPANIPVTPKIDVLSEKIGAILEGKTMPSVTAPSPSPTATPLSKKASKKAMYREMRRQRREGTPSPNGSNGASASASIVGAENGRPGGLDPGRAG